MASTRRPGSPTGCAASTTTPSPASTNFCPGTGQACTSSRSYLIFSRRRPPSGHLARGRGRGGRKARDRSPPSRAAPSVPYRLEKIRHLRTGIGRQHLAEIIVARDNRGRAAKLLVDEL